MALYRPCTESYTASISVLLLLLMGMKIEPNPAYQHQGVKLWFPLTIHRIM